MNLRLMESAEKYREFERLYLAIRQTEGRILTVEQLRHFPDISGFPYPDEWKVRLKSAKSLAKHIKGVQEILEIGCGNGWLSYFLALKGHHVTGLDINLFELEQAATAFNLPNLIFVYEDIFESNLPRGAFSHIIFSSSIQYFPSISDLFEAVFPLLNREGQIHIINSPIYEASEVRQAQERSQKYYKQLGFPEMAKYYYHHTYNEFRGYWYRVMDKRKFWRSSPFPWLIIERH